MYSVVLMAALTAGTSTPSWGCHGGCFGGGFGCHGFFRGLHGCRGGGYGGCYGGGYGGCYGCYGGGGYGGCYGCYGGSGYGYGSGWYFAASCYGAGCYGVGCYGVGCHGCTGMPAYGPGQVSPPTTTPGYAPGQVSPPTTPPGAPAPEQVPPPKKEEKTGAALNQARLIVDLPADARLYVDDRPTTTTSERRVFNSPRLEEGQTYYYILRAEVVRDGKTLSETKRVLVHAGDVIRESFLDLANSATIPAEASAGRVEANARR